MPQDFNDVICELMEKDPGKTAFGRRRAVPPARRHPAESRPPGRADDGRASGFLHRGGRDSADEGGETGPATLMSRLMRRELERQNRGGPVRRLFNRPAVIVTLLAIAIGVIVWTLLAAERGAAVPARRRRRAPRQPGRLGQGKRVPRRPGPRPSQPRTSGGGGRTPPPAGGTRRGAAGGAGGADGGADERGAMVLSGGDAAAAARRRGRGAAHLDGADAGVRPDAVGGTVGAAGGKGVAPGSTPRPTPTRSITAGSGVRCGRRCGRRSNCARKARRTRPTPCCKGCATLPRRRGGGSDHRGKGRNAVIE